MQQSAHSLMIEPIMDLELDPGSGQQVQASRWYELVPFHEPFAHDARIGTPEVPLGRLSSFLP